MKTIYSFSLLTLFIISLIACKKNNQSPSSYNQVDSVVIAKVETDPVLSIKGEDAADDPAIWINFANTSDSKIIGSNKKGGISVYSLAGKEIKYYPEGLINNVDVRYNFPLGNNNLIDIVGATNRTDNSIVLMKVDKSSGELSNIATRKIYSQVGEVYGFCFYNDIKTNNFYAFVGGKLGELEQYKLVPASNNTIDVVLVRTLAFASQSEGMVADDELGHLYVAEENHCIWKMNANPNSSEEKIKIESSDSLNKKIAYDLEGLTIYYGKNGKGYLIASVQGNFSYALFERDKGNKYIGSFKIKDGQIDGTEETDGLDVINFSLGDQFPDGMFIVQDGFNYDNDSLINQNFKLVSWRDIATLFEPNLLIDTEYLTHNQKRKQH
jgi:3-phytase